MAALTRRIAEHIRQYPPSGVEQARVEKCLDAIEAPCSLREQNLLRVIVEWSFSSPEQKSSALIEVVERIGLEPLPPIQKDDVHLICWMVVEAA